MSTTSRNFGYPLAAPRIDARSAAVWLLLIAVIGGVLTFSHGISKKFNDEWEYTQVESLSYEASPMAFAFAILMLVVGSLLMSMNGFGWLLNAPGQRRYIMYAPLLAGAFVWVVTATLNRVIPPVRGWTLAGGIGLGLMLANTRAAYVAVVLAL